MEDVALRGKIYGKPPYSQGKTESVLASKANPVFHQAVRGPLRPAGHRFVLADEPVKLPPSLNLSVARDGRQAFAKAMAGRRVTWAKRREYRLPAIAHSATAGTSTSLRSASPRQDIEC